MESEVKPKRKVGPIPLVIPEGYVQRLQAYRVPLSLDASTEKVLLAWGQDCVAVWNMGLRWSEYAYRCGQKRPNSIALKKGLTTWRQEHPAHAETPCCVQQNVLDNLDGAYQKFFKKLTKLPRHRDLGRPPSFTVNHVFSGLDLRHNRVKLPKIGWVKFRNKRAIEGEFRSVTVSRDSDRWFASILTRRAVPIPVHPSNTSIGLDVGVVHFATTSDGIHHELPASIHKLEAKLKRAQQRLSRKQKFGKNWRKQVARVQRVHSAIANVRDNFQHLLSKKLTDEHCLIAIEDMETKKMSRSAAGTVDKPGKNVASKRGLNRSISRQGWGMFATKLSYKAERVGATVLRVPPAYTSQKCSKCGHVSRDNRPSQGNFLCISCGHQENADVNAARNILSIARGIR